MSEGLVEQQALPVDEGGVVPPATAAQATVSVAPARQIVGLRALKGQRDALRAQVRQLWDVELPLSACGVQGQGGVTVLWAGEERWLVLAPQAEADLSVELADLLAGCAAVTDLGDSRVALVLRGPDARDVAAKLVPVDLHAAVFPPGATALTQAGHISVQLWCADAQPTYEFLVYRSLARTLAHDLRQVILAGPIHAKQS